MAAYAPGMVRGLEGPAGRRRVDRYPAGGALLLPAAALLLGARTLFLYFVRNSH